MRRAAALASLALALAACGDEAAPVYGATRGAAPDGALWVMTYNVNFEMPSDATVEAIREADADVVVLQETHEDWEARLARGLGDAYPHTLFRHAPAEGGMAILSRYAVEEVAYLPSPAGAFPAWCVSLETPLGALDVLAVHLHPPLDEDGRLLVGYFTTGGTREAELRQHLRCFESTPDLVLGDFNEETGDAVRHLEALGLRQAQVAVGPPERTWTWITGGVELEGRPDHIFFGPALAARAVQVVPRGASDHRPLRAAFVAATAEAR